MKVTPEFNNFANDEIYEASCKVAALTGTLWAGYLFINMLTSPPPPMDTEPGNTPALIMPAPTAE